MSEAQILSGKWSVNQDDLAYNGNLHFNEDSRYITLELLIPESSGGNAARFPYESNLSFISGTLLTGANVLLYDCEVASVHHHLMQYTQIIIYVNYAFWGLSSEHISTFQFKGACVDFGEVLSWFDLCKYEDLRNQDIKQHGYVWESTNDIEWTIDENLTVSFMPTTGGFGGRNYAQEITLRQSIQVRLEYQNDVSWKTVLQDIKKIQYLIGLGIKQRVEINELKYLHSDFYTIICEKTEERIWDEGDVLIGTGKVEKNRYTEPYNHLFSFNDFLRVENGAKNWFLYYEKLKPVLDLFFSVYGPVYSIEAAFLSLTQALETFHARFKANTIGEYRKRVEKLVSNLKDINNKELWRWFLMDDGQKKTKSIALKSRLSDLYFADEELPLMRETDLPPGILKKISDSRNYYTHYEEKKKDLAYTSEELQIVNGYLICLLQYHIMCIIGFSTSDAKKAVKKRVDALYRYLRKNNMHLYYYPDN